MLENTEYENSILETMRRMREATGTRQQTMAKVLGVTQPALSRIESGKQVLTFQQFMQLCQYYGESADSISQGKINYQALAQRFAQKTSSPSDGDGENLRVRSLLPMLRFSLDEKGYGFTERLLSECGLSGLAFMDPDGAVTMEAYLKMVDRFIGEQIITPFNFDKLLDGITDRSLHYQLDHIYQQQQSSLQLLQQMVSHHRHYGSPFSHRVLARYKKKLVVAVSPIETYNPQITQHSHLGEFFCRYHGEWLRRFPAYRMFPFLEIKEESCYFRNQAEACTYHLSLAV